MKGKTHLMGGLLFGLVGEAAVSSLSNEGILFARPATIGVVVGASLIGSLLPDIDTPKSILGSKVPPISIIINKLCGHRNITHSIMMWLLLFAPIKFLFEEIDRYPFLIYYGLLVGILSHIFLDMLTTRGVPVFVKSPRISLTPMKTGGAGEILVRVVLVTCIALYSIGSATNFLNLL